MFGNNISLDPNADGSNERKRKTNHPISLVKDYYGVRHEDIRGAPGKKLVGTNSRGEEIKKSVTAKGVKAFYYTIRNGEMHPLDISQYQVVNKAFGVTSEGVPRENFEFLELNGEPIDNYAIIHQFVSENFNEDDFLADREDFFKRKGRELPLEDLEQIVAFRKLINENHTVEDRNNLIRKVREEFSTKEDNATNADTKPRRGKKAEDAS